MADTHADAKKGYMYKVRMPSVGSEDQFAPEVTMSSPEMGLGFLKSCSHGAHLQKKLPF